VKQIRNFAILCVRGGGKAKSQRKRLYTGAEKQQQKERSDCIWENGSKCFLCPYAEEHVKKLSGNGMYSGKGEHMTVKQWIKKHGWQRDCDARRCRYMSVDVGFVNSEGREDETQLDIGAYDMEELSSLFADFCRENKFPQNTVHGVTIVKMAGTMEALI